MTALPRSSRKVEQDDGWIEWAGGECPVPPETQVCVQFRCETGEQASEDSDSAKYLRWDHQLSAGNRGGGDIIAYRPAQP